MKPSQTTLTPTPIPSPQGGGEHRASPPVAPSPQSSEARLVKVKVHGREAWLPEAEVIAEAQKSLAAGNLLESAKEVLSGARSQMSDAGDQISDVRGQMSAAATAGDCSTGLAQLESGLLVLMSHVLPMCHSEARPSAEGRGSSAPGR